MELVAPGTADGPGVHEDTVGDRVVAGHHALRPVVRDDRRAALPPRPVGLHSPSESAVMCPSTIVCST